MENNARCLGKAYGCSLRLLTHTSRSTAGTFYWGGRSSGLGLLILRFELVFSSSCLQATELLWAEFFPFKRFLHWWPPGYLRRVSSRWGRSVHRTWHSQRAPAGPISFRPVASSWAQQKNKVSGTWELVHCETHLPETLWGHSALRLEQITMSDTDHDAPESSIKVSNYGENLVSESRKMW